MVDGSPFKNFYGRVSSHLSGQSSDLMRNLLPQYQLEIGDLENLCSRYKEINLEIGFGTGDFIFESSGKKEDSLYIGAEVFKNGIASLLGKLENHPRENLKIYDGNVYTLFTRLKEEMLDNIYVLFPDPWPKKKHHKRRIINLENLEFFAKLLKINGNLRIVSDHRDYVEDILEKILASNIYHWQVQSIDDMLIAPQDHIQTKYERKALALNSAIYYINLKVKK